MGEEEKPNQPKQNSIFRERERTNFRRCEFLPGFAVVKDIRLRADAIGESTELRMVFAGDAVLYRESEPPFAFPAA